jgi:hypothetical protein
MIAQAHANAKKITIYIDSEAYKTTAGSTSVAAVRELRQPAAREGDELWLDIDEAQDQQLDPSATIDLVDGMRFFTEIDPISIRIDRLDYDVFKRKMTGAELRVVPTPDVAADRDLWLDVPDKRDVKVQDEDTITLKDGTRFFTAPGRINPGVEQ